MNKEYSSFQVALEREEKWGCQQAREGDDQHVQVQELLKLEQVNSKLSWKEILRQQLEKT